MLASFALSLQKKSSFLLILTNLFKAKELKETKHTDQNTGEHLNLETTSVKTAGCPPSFLDILAVFPQSFRLSELPQTKHNCERLRNGFRLPQLKLTMLSTSLEVHLEITLNFLV